MVVAPVVTFADAEPNGLADLVGRLLEANLERDPARWPLLRPAVVVLEASDAEVRATLRISPEGIEVANGAASSAHLRVRADAFDLIELAGAPLRWGLPDAFDPQGRAALGRILSGHVRVRGMLRHPVRLSRFTRLLTVVG